MDFEVLMNSMFWFEKVLEKLCLFDLLQCERVSKLFYEAINQDSVWRTAANTLFEGKVFVPAICHRFLIPGNSRNYRKDLEQCTIRDLKLQCASFGLNFSACCEKSDIITLINQFQLNSSYSDECLAKFAVRIAWIDRRRTTITLEELLNTNWRVRIRADGPLAWLCDQDPWWQNAPTGAGKAKYHADGKLTFEYPEEYDPFRDFAPAFLYYELEGSIIKLNVGVQERLCRHPDNWGWVMMSGGTVWTGFEMPPRNADPFLEDYYVESLLQSSPNYGFCFAKQT